MKKAFRFLILVLIFVMVGTVFTGCGASTPKTTGSSGSTNNETASDSGNGGSESKSSQEAPLEIHMTVRLFDQVPDMNNSYWREYQKRTNTKLIVEWIPDGDYATKLNLILASNQIPEVLVANCSNDLNNPIFINAVKNGAFWDLTDILGDFSKYPNLKNNVAPDAWVTSRVLGRIYGVPQSRPQVQSAPIIREDLLEEAGVEMPTTMNGLLDAMEAVLKKHPNMVGLVSKQNMFINSSGGLASAFGTDTPTYNDEGGLIYSKLTPQFTKFIEWLREAYKRGLLPKEFSVMKPTQAVELFQSGSAVVLVNEAMRWCYPFTQTLQKVKKDAKAQFVPPLEGDPGKYAITKSTGVADSMFIASTVSKEKMLRILDYFEKTTTQEYYDLTAYGVEGIHYNIVNGYKVVTPLHDKELGSSAPWQVLPLAYNPYMKLDSVTSPEEYNIAQRKRFADLGYEEKGILDPFSVATSQTWISVWPKYQQEWAAKCVQAVMGQISIEEYQQYVDKINSDPEIKKAYQEFAQSYKDIFGKQ